MLFLPCQVGPRRRAAKVPCVERKLNIERGGLVLRKQPPIRVRWCHSWRPPDEGRMCDPDSPYHSGEQTRCGSCHFLFCAKDLKTHVNRLSVPPDAWKGVLKGIAIEAQRILKAKKAVKGWKVSRQNTERLSSFQLDGRLIDSRRPRRIEYCKVPTTGNIDLSCGLRTKTCTPDSVTCPQCGFTYCTRHEAGHIRRLVLPGDYWEKIVTSFERELDKCAKTRGRSFVWVRAPRFKRHGGQA